MYSYIACNIFFIFIRYNSFPYQIEKKEINYFGDNNAIKLGIRDFIFYLFGLY